MRRPRGAKSDRIARTSVAMVQKRMTVSLDKVVSNRLYTRMKHRPRVKSNDKTSAVLGDGHFTHEAPLPDGPHGRLGDDTQYVADYKIMNKTLHSLGVRLSGGREGST